MNHSVTLSFGVRAQAGPVTKVEEHHDSDDKELSERQWGLVNREA